MAEIKTVLTELPDPAYGRLSDLQSGIDYYYTADQMRAYAEAAVLSANAGKVDAAAVPPVDEPVDRYGRTAAQERKRQIDNRLLQLIQRFFPSLPVAPGYTDWAHWLRFANEAAKIHASPTQQAIDAGRQG